MKVVHVEPACGCCHGLLALFKKKKTDDEPASRRGDRFYSCQSLEEMERKAEEEADAERACILDMVEVPEVGGKLWRRRSSTLREEQVDAILSYRDQFFDCIELTDESAQRMSRRTSSLVPPNSSPWGRPDTRGAVVNSWDEADATSFQVRGPNFAADRKKVKSKSPLGQLVSVDLFESETDIAHMTACKPAGTIRRIRASGDSRRLFIINFRVVPLHLVMVFALPPADQKGDAASDLIHRFASGKMTDAERNQRLKVIPRVVQGPWVAKGLLGETPAIVGKKIPTQYFVGANEFEASFQCTASSVAQRIVRVLKPAASALTIELAFLVQGNDKEELPERIMGSIRLISPDVSTLRDVDPSDTSFDTRRVDPSDTVF